VSLPDGEEPARPGVYARLAQQAEVSRQTLHPGRWVRWVGWLICLSLAGGVVAAALRAHPW